MDSKLKDIEKSVLANHVINSKEGNDGEKCDEKTSKTPLNIIPPQKISSPL